MPLLENQESKQVAQNEEIAVNGAHAGLNRPNRLVGEIENHSQDQDDQLMQSTIILFDWDDTLCPSFDLNERGFSLTTEFKCHMTDSELRQLEASVINLLELAFQYGDVHIVTNAETGWVQLSANKFLPGVLPLLERVKVISARSTYEKLFPDCPYRWKFHAFKDNLAMIANQTEIQKNILSFGDSHFEREAIRHVTHGLVNTLTKSVKFKERPKIEQLRRQIELVISCFQYIHNHDGDLDLQLSISLHETDDPSEALRDMDDSPIRQVHGNHHDLDVDDDIHSAFDHLTAEEFSVEDF